MQTGYSLGNTSSAVFRATLNVVLQAIASSNSGPTAPPEVYPGMIWPDTTAKKIKQRTQDNLSWKVIGDLDADNWGLATQVALQQGGYNTAIAGGTADAITANFTPEITAGVLSSGSVTLMVWPTGPNTSTAPSFTPGAGIPPTVIVKGDDKPLSPGDIAGPAHPILLKRNPLSGKWALLNPATGISATPSLPAVPVRQAVVSGPVDSNGYSSFGGSTGGSTVTGTGTLIMSAANGFNSAGAIDKVFQITNPSWTGLSVNGVMYLYVDYNNGNPVTGSTTLAPIYQQGGSFSATSGQHVFNIKQMQMQVGNGTTAVQAYRVFVGEVAVVSGAVSSITWYAVGGVYESPLQPIAAGTPTSFSHNLGIRPRVRPMVVLVAQATDAGYAVGDELSGGYELNTSTNAYGVAVVADSVNTVRTVPGANGVAAPNKSTGAASVLTLASWKQKVIVQRGW